MKRVRVFTGVDLELTYTSCSERLPVLLFSAKGARHVAIGLENKVRGLN
jgi:hypothetical protein